MDILLIVLLVLVVLAVAGGFAVHWLFIFAVVLVVVALLYGVGSRRR